MANLVKPNQKDLAAARYKNARIYLLLVAFFSAFNVLFLFQGVDRFYIISAVIPFMGTLYWQLYPGTGLAAAALAVCVIYLLLLVLSWVFSKNKPGWLIAGCILYALDLIPVFFVYQSTRERTFLVSLVFHGLLIGMIIYGIFCRVRLHNGAADFVQIREEIPVRGSALRRADMEAKARILLKAEFEGHLVLYRRVKKVNELVIDNYVYDEIELGIEPAHSLSARIDGKLYEVGYDGRTLSYFSVDGVRKAQKTRWY